MDKIKTIAIHLPQFHPFLENDEWWGKGFTEWTNVAKALPLFKDHYQPHLPSDLGYYDLRLEETRIQQAEMASAYGISGFCYYHYWFNGKRLLNRPLDDMLNTKTPNFPFMLCWANENWTRKWDGLDHELLIKQHYSEEDDLAHIRFLAENFFSDERYIRVDGKPFFVVYRPSNFPDIKRTSEIWRKEAMRLGIGDLYLGYIQGFNFRTPPKEIGFDCAIEFSPDFWNKNLTQVKPTVIQTWLHEKNIRKHPFLENKMIDYRHLMDVSIQQSKENNQAFPAITPMWDNASRRKTGATVMLDSTPELYGKWLKELVNIIKQREGEKFIFINAWNEWAEGNHLEPCQKWGRAYLEATKNALYNA